ncbi:MAG TPA: beta-ketoacyl synthase N-terminal-like domain-containing protein [Bacillota bacterium]|nr:beta-ketoacyl synthase N-terminal-like domain-containing protein [Bacillota bacterium]
MQEIILIFAKRDDLFGKFTGGEGGAAQVLPAGERIFILIKPGNSYRQLDEFIYQINPLEKEDYQRLFIEITARFHGIHYLFHLWNYEDSSLDYINHGNIQKLLRLLTSSLELGILSLELLTEALYALPLRPEPAIYYWSHGDGTRFQPQQSLTLHWNLSRLGSQSRFSFYTVHFPDPLPDLEEQAKLLRDQLTWPKGQLGAFLEPPPQTGPKIHVSGLGPESDRGPCLQPEGSLGMDGHLPQIRQTSLSEMNPESLVAGKETGIVSFANDTGLWVQKIKEDLILKISKMLMVKPEEIDFNAQLSEFGLDSVFFIEFSNELNWEYKINLNPAIFFEYSNLQLLAEYLLKEYPAVWASKYAPAGPQTLPMRESPSVAKDSSTEKSLISKIPVQWMKPVTPAETKTEANPEQIAVIGMSGIFPGARDLTEFWRNLVSGKSCITEIPPDRWDWREYFGDPAVEINKTNIKYGGFIEGVANFDPLFFGISPREAELMDPQQRLLLTYAWKAIEDAGYGPSSLSGTATGVFIGTIQSGYVNRILQPGFPIEGYTATGVTPSIGPHRLSYLLNLHGPSEPIETACSSSLVAIHRAVEAICSGSCEMAIVGGVQTILTPEGHISFSKAGMLSRDGRCKTFSDQADGYVRGEGVGMLFLKKLKAAEAAGDHIYGVIRGTAENHGGRANSLTAPNPKAQAEVIRNAYQKAGVDPRTVSYIETHGTGTELGDPIEINGLKLAFQELYQTMGVPQVTFNYCGLGSVKTNIGHVELAAGVAGVIKVILQFKHHTLVQSLHCQRINPYIQLQDSPFYIVRENQAWKPLQDSGGKDIPRRAGVSSFGFGGANAHIVMEEYIPPKREKLSEPSWAQNPAIIVLSAKNGERLRDQVRQLLEFITDPDSNPLELADLAYTLQSGRDSMEERLGLLVGSLEELAEKLKATLENTGVGTAGSYQGQVAPHRGTIGLLAGDEEFEETVDQWIRRQKYGKLLELWVKGLPVDWNKLYRGVDPRRISLPTYPFAQNRYWIETGAKTAEPVPYIPLAEPGVRAKGGAGDSLTVAGNSDLKQNIAAIWKEVLGVPSLESLDNLQELGGDSIMMTQIISRLKRCFPFELDLNHLFGAATVAEMADLIERALIQKLKELPEDPSLW